MLVELSPDGQVNEPLRLPFEIESVEASVTIVLQPPIPISIVAVPLSSAGQGELPVASCTPLPVTVTVEPAAPDEGLIAIEGAVGVHAALTPAAACAGNAAPQLSAVSANASTAKHTISAMLVETIFDRFTPVFMLPSPKGPS